MSNLPLLKNRSDAGINAQRVDLINAVLLKFDILISEKFSRLDFYTTAKIIWSYYVMGMSSASVVS